MLRVHDLHSYYDLVHVLDGVDLDINESEVVGLVGRNGMGKTTLVRSIAGLSPPNVRGGTISWEGDEIVGLKSYEISRRGIGIVPQGRQIFGRLSVLENLTMAARPAKNGDSWTLDGVFDLFPRLKDRRAIRGASLSGGEQQMLAIGRALLTNPRLLLMDEPSEGLAPIIVRQLRESLQRLRGERMSILLVEQNLGLVLSAADRIYVLEAGRIAWEGSSEHLIRDPDIAKQYLGV